MKRGREEEEGGERAKKMARRADLAAGLARAQAELDTLKANDPREIANLEKELQLVTQAAHRWTDNIFSCKDYLVKKRGMMKKDGELSSIKSVVLATCEHLITRCVSIPIVANKFLNITDNFDCECFRNFFSSLLSFLWMTFSALMLTLPHHILTTDPEDKISVK